MVQRQQMTTLCDIVSNDCILHTRHEKLIEATEQSVIRMTNVAESWDFIRVEEQINRAVDALEQRLLRYGKDLNTLQKGDPPQLEHYINDFWEETEESSSSVFKLKLAETDRDSSAVKHRFLFHILARKRSPSSIHLTGQNFNMSDCNAVLFWIFYKAQNHIDFTWHRSEDIDARRHTVRARSSQKEVFSICEAVEESPSKSSRIHSSSAEIM